MVVNRQNLNRYIKPTTFRQYGYAPIPTVQGGFLPTSLFTNLLKKGTSKIVSKAAPTLIANTLKKAVGNAAKTSGKKIIGNTLKTFAKKGSQSSLRLLKNNVLKKAIPKVTKSIMNKGIIKKSILQGTKNIKKSLPKIIKRGTIIGKRMAKRKSKTLLNKLSRGNTNHFNLLSNQEGSVIKPPNETVTNVPNTSTVSSLAPTQPSEESTVVLPKNRKRKASTLEPAKKKKRTSLSANQRREINKTSVNNLLRKVII